MKVVGTSGERVLEGLMRFKHVSGLGDMSVTEGQLYSGCKSPPEDFLDITVENLKSFGWVWSEFEKEWYIDLT